MLPVGRPAWDAGQRPSRAISAAWCGGSLRSLGAGTTIWEIGLNDARQWNPLDNPPLDP